MHFQGGKSPMFGSLELYASIWSCAPSGPCHKGGGMVFVHNHPRILMVKGAFATSPISSFSTEALLWFAKAQKNPVSSLWQFLDYKWTWTSTLRKFKLVVSSEKWLSSTPELYSTNMACSNPMALHLHALHVVRKYCLQLLPAKDFLFWGITFLCRDTLAEFIYIACQKS